MVSSLSAATGGQHKEEKKEEEKEENCVLSFLFLIPGGKKERDWKGKKERGTPNSTSCPLS